MPNNRQISTPESDGQSCPHCTMQICGSSLPAAYIAHLPNCPALSPAELEAELNAVMKVNSQILPSLCFECRSTETVSFIVHKPGCKYAEEVGR